MDRPLPASPSLARLIADIVDGTPADSMASDLGAWLSTSPGFRRFATANVAKMRKKLRGTGDVEALRDVRLELLVARLLTADRRIGLAWEPYGSGRVGPDFAVSLPGSRTTNLEVTRLHRAPDSIEPGVPWLAKLRQLPPSVPNVLVVGVDGTDAGVLDVAGSVRAIRALADARDDAFFTSRAVPGSRGFYDRFLRLGAVITFAEAANGDARAALWSNGSARIGVPDAVTRACMAALRTGVA